MRYSTEIIRACALATVLVALLSLAKEALQRDPERMSSLAAL
jgi:hypothetical protein